MARRITGVVLSGVVLALAATSIAWAQAAWTVYRNADFHFVMDAPVPPQETVSTTQTGAGPMPTLQAMMDMGEHGALLITALDLSGMNTDATPDQLLEGGVKGALDNTKATLDTKITVTINGAVGREFTAHNDTAKFKTRLIYQNRRIYGITAAVGLAGVIPPEWDRIAATLTPLP